MYPHTLTTLISCFGNGRSGHSDLLVITCTMMYIICWGSASDTFQYRNTWSASNIVVLTMLTGCSRCLLATLTSMGGCVRAWGILSLATRLIFNKKSWDMWIILSSLQQVIFFLQQNIPRKMNHLLGLSGLVTRSCKISESCYTKCKACSILTIKSSGTH